MKNTQKTSTSLAAAVMPVIASSKSLDKLEGLMSALNLESVSIEQGTYGARITSASIDVNINEMNKRNVIAFTSIANQYLIEFMERPLLASKIKASAGKKKQNIQQYLADKKASQPFIDALNQYVDADDIMVYFESTGQAAELTTATVPGVQSIELSLNSLNEATIDIKTNIIPLARELAKQSTSLQNR